LFEATKVVHDMLIVLIECVCKKVENLNCRLHVKIFFAIAWAIWDEHEVLVLVPLNFV